MKQFILLIIFLFLQITGQSQAFSVNPSGWDNNSNIEAKKNQIELKIFPNPCKDKKITVELNTDLLSEIRLINIAGREIFLKRIEIPVNRLQIELTDFPNGIYMVQVKTVDNKIVVKKLLITAN